MKKLFPLLGCLLLFFNLQAQEICESLAQLKSGTIIEYTDFDKKGKPFTKSKHTTTNINANNGTVTAIVTVDITDLKNKNNNFSNEYEISCDDGVIAVDMMRFFDSSRMSTMENMEVSVDGNALNFPNDADAGDSLDDGYVTVSAGSGGVNVMTMTLNFTNRRVEAEESITTPAGTFKCKKFVYDFNSKMGIIKVQGSAAQWFTDDMVMVQSITKNKKGKEISKTLLTSIK